jgi:phage terminase large subunit-like protein
VERKTRAERPSGCRFSEKYAQRAVDFFERCLRHTTGEYVNQPFKLADFQAIDIREIFGRVDEDNNRIIRTVYKRVPKKQGKSEEGAGIALKLLLADNEPGAEVYGAAADRDQAAIIFRVAASMVRRNPELESRCRVIDSTKRIVCPRADSFYRALSAEVSGKHGFNSHGVIFDEVHAQADTRLWEALTFGAGAARRQPLTYAITTAGIPGESPVAEMLDETADQVLRGIIPCPPSFYPVVYAAEDGADWHDPDVWWACNPALGTDEDVRAGRKFLRLSAVREEYERALRSSTEQNSFRRLRLNQWVAQETRWIDMDDWDKAGKLDEQTAGRAWQAWMRSEIAELKDCTWFGGLDLSTRLDLTAFVLVCRDARDVYHFLPWFWIPADNLTERPHMETSKYRQWIKQGLLTATAGNAVDFRAVRERIVEITKELRVNELAFDPAFATETAQKLGESGLTMVECKQNYRTFTEPCREFEAAIRDGRIAHGGHPILRWMADCVMVKQDASGMVRPVKPERMKSSKRIDGIVAALMGMSRVIVQPNAADLTGSLAYVT